MRHLTTAGSIAWLRAQCGAGFVFFNPIDPKNSSKSSKDKKKRHVEQPQSVQVQNVQSQNIQVQAEVVQVQTEVVQKNQLSILSPKLVTYFGMHKISVVVPSVVACVFSSGGLSKGLGLARGCCHCSPTGALFS